MKVYIATIPSRFLDTEHDAGFHHTHATAIFECTHDVVYHFHHKDGFLVLNLRVLPLDGEMEEYPFCLMSDEEVMEMLEFYNESAVPSNLRNSYSPCPFVPCGLVYTSDN